MARSTVFSGTGSRRVSVVEVNKAVGVGYGQCFIAVVTNQLLTETPVLGRICRAGTKRE